MLTLKRIASLLITIILVISISGCEWASKQVTELKGDITGNEYNIDTFDNYGQLTLKTHGKKITVSPNIVRDRVYDTDNGWGYAQTESSVITITIDGKEMESCGDTCIFYDKKLTPDYDFTVESIDSDDNGNILNNTLFAKSVNMIKNVLGKSRVVVIKSQMGTPIYAFSGNSIYWEVDENLPKFTKLSVDGHPLYIHRANFQIIDTALIDNVE